MRGGWTQYEKALTTEAWDGQKSMVDFKKLRESKAKPKPINPREIFNTLPKPPGISDIYASQAEVLDGWFGRRTEKDVVVKLHTGGGKTLVALLMAQSVMNETGEPVLYLAPNNQLVQQVIAKSRDYGISATPYVSGQPLPGEFLNGSAVLVGAYQALFHGHSKFGVRLSSTAPVKAGAIILDDAHAALASVRQAFTLEIPSNKHPDLYSDLAGCFRTAFRDVGRNGTFADIVAGSDFGVVEVPSWAWFLKLPEVQGLLSAKAGVVAPFVWPFLRDNLALCHCLFSKAAVSITPIFPLVDLLPTFQVCPRRIYMSATIADDSEIIRTFDASPDAISKPITSSSLAGVGERMILVPQLMKLGTTPIVPMVKKLSKKVAHQGRGVVILSPSDASAKTWTDTADYPENAQAVLDKVAALQSKATFGPVVLANRYDGIDLAGDACRLLVMDDLPQGTSNYDIFRMNAVADAAVSSLLAQRIEQGIGRGARGGADHCAVLLIGSKLVSWIGRRKNLAYLTSSTRAQLNLGQEVSREVASVDDLEQTINNCLDRDADWKAYHASELAEAARADPVDSMALKVAATERRAFGVQRLGQFGKAIIELEDLSRNPQIAGETQRRAWLAASAARIAFQAGEDDRGEQLQTRAFSLNNNHSPPRTRPQYVPRPVAGTQSGVLVARLREFERPQGLLAEFEEAVSELVPEASANRYEQALESLGSFLGFEAERPDKVYGIGPDVVWHTDAAFDFVIEAKNRKGDNNSLRKREHAQLLEAEQWFKQTYPGRASVRVSALPHALADDKASPAGTFALTMSDVSRLVSALRGALTELVGMTGPNELLLERCEVGLRTAALKPEAIKSTYMRRFDGSGANAAYSDK